MIAAGERWPDDSLRPAAEDLWGAGAILHGLIERRGPDGFTAEARSVAAAFAAVAGDLSTALRDCTSGRELRDRGFGSDVTIAAEFDASDRVPVLRDGAFRSP